MFNEFRLNNLRGDIYGGLTAAVVALPLALAFGVSSGAGPIAGLYGAIFVGFFAAVFGGTPAQVSGPTGPMTVVMAAIFTQYAALDPVHGPALAFAVVVMAGLMQIGMGLLRVGNYINLVPAPVISGFMSGIGVIIILLQIQPLFGIPAESSALAAARNLPAVVDGFVTDAIMLGVLTLMVVYIWPKALAKLLPAPLAALIIGTLTLVFVFPNGDASILGEIPTGFPSPSLPVIPLTLLPGMLKSAFILALLGAIDSLLTSLVADNVTRGQHNSNRELIGQGIGNTVAGLFGGLPGAGATMRTVVNVRAGGQTAISGALHALVLVAIVLGAGRFASYIPHAVLAGILIKVGTDIIDWDYFSRIPNTSIVSVLLMFTVLSITVFIDLITAVAVGMFLASFFYMKRMSDMQLKSIKAIRDPRGEKGLSEQETVAMERVPGQILLYVVSGPISFPAAKSIVRNLGEITGYDALVLDLSEVPTIDYTSSRAIEDIILNAQHAKREIFLVGLSDDVIDALQTQRVLEHIDDAHRCSRRLDALNLAAEKLVTDKSDTKD